MTLEFYTNPHSRGQIAHWMMEEVGAPYETHWLKWGPEGHKGADYLAVNPMGKVPALRHDGKIVTEAAAICLYMADVFPDAGLKPGADKLAEYYRWVLFAAGPLEQALTTKMMGWDVPEERKATVGFGDYEDAVGTLEKMLEGACVRLWRGIHGGGRLCWLACRLGADVQVVAELARRLKPMSSGSGGETPTSARRR